MRPVSVDLHHLLVCIYYFVYSGYAQVGFPKKKGELTAFLMADLSVSVGAGGVVWVICEAAKLPYARTMMNAARCSLGVWMGRDCCWLDAHRRRMLAGVRLDMCLML